MISADSYYQAKRRQKHRREQFYRGWHERCRHELSYLGYTSCEIDKLEPIIGKLIREYESEEYIPEDPPSPPDRLIHNYHDAGELKQYIHFNS